MDARSELLAELGRTLRELRKQRRWTRKDLSLRSGVSERFLAEIENGRGNPSLLRLFDLAAAFGTTPEAMLHGLASTPSAGRRVVALLGLRGAGKSTVGHRLAVALRLRFVELDAVNWNSGPAVGEPAGHTGSPATSGRKHRRSRMRIAHRFLV
jgi:XRE family aerobic/anaerobic benzoate catabolism transcriptional regulator